MHKSLSVTTAVLLTAAAVCAQKGGKPAGQAAAPAEAKAAPAAAAGGEVALNDQRSRVSYILGNNIGQNMKRDDLDLDLDALLLGIKDALAGQESRVSDADTEAAMQKFQQDVQAQRQKAAGEMAEKNKSSGASFLAENAKREGVKTTASGLQYEVIKEGSGPKPKASDTVEVHYHGTLPDGTVFDSSVERGEPATFPVGQVIPGWVEALQLMPVGSKWKLFIPSDLAYGERGAPPDIQPNQPLIFEVELLNIKK